MAARIFAAVLGFILTVFGGLMLLSQAYFWYLVIVQGYYEGAGQKTGTIVFAFIAFVGCGLLAYAFREEK